MKKTVKWLKRLAGAPAWKPEWQDQLNEALKDAQRGLGLHMVVVIARESDYYGELLYLLSVFGLGVGVLLAYLLEGHLGLETWDLIALPVGGFALGSLLFGARGYFLNRFAPKAVRERAAARAKTQYFDHEQHFGGPLVLLYFSELEREALLLSTPENMEVFQATPEIPRVLSKLVRHYNRREPTLSMGPCLRELGEAMRLKFATREGEAAPTGRNRSAGQVYVQASDQASPALRVPILKGSKDIN